MKKVSYYVAILLFSGLMISCGNQAVENEKENDSDVENIEQSETNEEAEENTEEEFVSVQHTIKARFVMQNLSTAGVVFSVEDDNGNDYIFWDRNPDAKGLQFLNNHPANEPLTELENTWFELTYENRMCEFFDGSTGDYYEREELVIFEAKPWNVSTSVEKNVKFDGFTPEFVSTLYLFGTEPFWNISLYADHAIYSTPEFMDKKMYYLSPDESNMGFVHINDALKVLKDGAVSFRIQEGGSSEYITLTISEGVCNDGMSPGEYPFTVTYQLFTGQEFEGCGNVKSK